MDKVIHVVRDRSIDVGLTEEAVLASEVEQLLGQTTYSQSETSTSSSSRVTVTAISMTAVSITSRLAAETATVTLTTSIVSTVPLATTMTVTAATTLLEPCPVSHEPSLWLTILVALMTALLLAAPIAAWVRWTHDRKLRLQSPQSIIDGSA